ncbi:MAG: acylneuraminate cytidylyltransferase family protein [Opitutales bacterium]|nr:acylneuraminate cytidylyltransferase family protein [Opitutales bacterium]
MRVLAVIPARGGSKGIPYKNLVDFCGKPLLTHCIDCVLDSTKISELCVSTEDSKISAAAKEAGVKVVPRPLVYASDSASTESVLIHALDFFEEKWDLKFDAVLTLQPTSPFREAKLVDDFIEVFEEKYPDKDAMLTLHEDRSDFWIREESSFKRRQPNAPRRRQEREPLYVENSCLYITGTSALRKTKSVLGQSCEGYLIDRELAIDINDKADLHFARALYLEQKKDELNRSH